MPALSCPNCGKPIPLATTHLNALTPRLRQVAALYARGIERKEIAERLGIPLHCVAVAIYRIYRKLRVSSQVQLCTLIHGLSE